MKKLVALFLCVFLLSSVVVPSYGSMVYVPGQNTATGTVTEVDTGTGLTGGPITTTGTVSVAPSSDDTLAGYDHTGVFSDVTVGSGLSLSGGTLSATGGGSGTVNSGTGGQLTWYATTGTAVSGNANATISNGALTLGQSSTAGSVTLNGSSSGTCLLGVPAAAGTGTIFTLPPNNGTSGYYLKTDGSGVTSWVAPGTGAVTAVSNSDGTLTISPTTGAVVASLHSLASTNILVGNGSNVATAVALSGDGTLANTGAITVTKTNGSAFAASATTDTTNAGNISSGLLAMTLGGTGSNLGASAAAGKIYCANNSTTSVLTAAGAANQVLTSAGASTPLWANGMGIGTASVTTTKILTAADKYLQILTGGTYQVTLPAASGVTGLSFAIVYASGSGTVTIAAGGGNTIEGAASIALTTPGQAVMLSTDTTTSWKVIACSDLPGTGISSSFTGGVNTLSLTTPVTVANGGTGSGSNQNAFVLFGGPNAPGASAAAAAFNSYDSAVIFGGASNTRALPTTGTITGEYWSSGNWTQTGPITSNRARIHVAGTMTINNTWTVATEGMGGAGGGTGAGVAVTGGNGSGLAGGQCNAGIQADVAIGGGGAGHGGNGGNGGAGGAYVVPNAGIAYPLETLLQGSGGGGGCGFGVNIGGGGGAAGGSLYIEATGNISFTSGCAMTATGGAGGAVSATSTAGGGGGSGGGIMIRSLGTAILAASGTITATGGAGGAASSVAVAGGGGGAGGIIDISGSTATNSGTATAAGGAAGGGDTGTASSAGSAGVVNFNSQVQLVRTAN